jgi:hypothetical protein
MSRQHLGKVTGSIQAGFALQEQYVGADKLIHFVLMLSRIYGPKSDIKKETLEYTDRRFPRAALVSLKSFSI